MKKILSLLLAGSLTFGLAACGEDTTSTSQMSAFEIYQITQEKIEATGQIAADMDMSMAFTINIADAEPITMDSQMTGSLQQVMKSETDMDLAMEMTVDSMGTSSLMMGYYTEGYYYTEMEGIKYKVQMDMEDALATVSTLNSTDFDLTEDSIISSSVTEAGGITTVNLLIDGDQMSEDVRDMMSALENMVGEGAYDMLFEDIDMTITVDEDYNMLSSDVYMAMTIVIPDDGTVGEMSAGMEMQMYMEVTATEGVVVELPEDLEAYDDYTDLMYYY